MENERTQVIILQKTPYRESDLVAVGLSPDVGRLSLLLRGARKVEAKKFPCADLYRELDVEYPPSDRSELYTPVAIDLCEDYSALADDPEKFRFAGKIGAFLLRNSPPEVAMPFTYDTLKHVLFNLAAGSEALWTIPESSVIVKLTYLYENGLLPGLSGGTPQEAKALELFEAIVGAGIDYAPLPECRADYWPQLNNYLNGLIAANSLAWS